MYNKLYNKTLIIVQPWTICTIMYKTLYNFFIKPIFRLYNSTTTFQVVYAVQPFVQSCTTYVQCCLKLYRLYRLYKIVYNIVTVWFADGRVEARPAHHPEIEQLLHLVLRRAVGANHGGRWARIRVAAEARWATEVGAQPLNVELREDAPRRGYV